MGRRFARSTLCFAVFFSGAIARSDEPPFLDPSFGVLAWDQIHTIAKESREKAGRASEPSFFESRDAISEIGGVPFPAQSHKSNRQINSGLLFKIVDTMDQGFCEDIIHNLKVSDGESLNLFDLFFYLIGERPSDAEMEQLKAIHKSATSTENSGQALAATCMAILGSIRFLTY